MDQFANLLLSVGPSSSIADKLNFIRQEREEKDSEK